MPTGGSGGIARAAQLKFSTMFGNAQAIFHCSLADTLLLMVIQSEKPHRFCLRVWHFSAKWWNFYSLEPRLMLPYCLQIGAGTEQVFTSFSGSASCPLGSAVSGWYNLPAVPVKASAFSPVGGPKNFTGLQLRLSPTKIESFDWGAFSTSYIIMIIMCKSVL